jgi:hypothetical protein
MARRVRKFRDFVMPFNNRKSIVAPEVIRYPKIQADQPERDAPLPGLS